MRTTRLLLCLLALAAAAPAQEERSDEFPILVWCQPKRSIGFWQSVGINTVVNGDALPTARKRFLFLEACRVYGVKGVLATKHYSPELDKHPALGMWRLVDEPDLNPVGKGESCRPRIPPGVVAGEAARTEGRTKPLWLNTTVRFYEPYQQLAEHYYEKYFRIADFCGYDHYPVTGWNLPQRIPEFEPATRRCVELAKSRPVIVIVEASDQNLAWTPKETRGPTAAEMRAEIFLALVGGARGIGYFANSFRPFKWRNLEPSIVQEIRRTNGELARNARFLARPAPADVGVLSSCRAIRAGVRRDGGDLLVIAVNRSRREQRATLQIGGRTLEVALGPLEGRLLPVGRAVRPESGNSPEAQRSR